MKMPVLPWAILATTAITMSFFYLAPEPAWAQSSSSSHEPAAGAEIDSAGSQLLRTSLLGRLEPGGEPRLAVRWDGLPGALLDVWVDLDGDDAVDPGELVVRGRKLDPDIVVVDLDIPAEAYAVPEPRLWVRAQEADQPVSLEGLPLDAKGTASCAWQPGFHLSDLDQTARASVVFDDGTGPALYVGGSFRNAGHKTVNYIARWDGSGWSALSGPSGAGTDGTVYALEVYDDGNGPALFAGGRFSMAGGVSANNVARWDGSTWSALGTGTDYLLVRALEVYDDGDGPALYAGGLFTSAGGVTVNNVAKWNGSIWSALTGASGTGTDALVDVLATYDDGDGPKLYAGGDFATAGGLTVNNIAAWNGAGWSALGTGTSGEVLALAVFDDGGGPALFAGGEFSQAGSVPVNFVARWNGYHWTGLDGVSGTGTSFYVHALAVANDGTGEALFVGGSFSKAGGVTTNNIARWNGTSWAPLTGPSATGTNGYVYALGAYDDGTGPALLAGGTFSTAGGSVANRVATWNGNGWSALSNPSGMGSSDTVRALVVFDDGTGPALYVGGSLSTAGGTVVNHIGRWDGSWSSLGSGTNGSTIIALAVYDDGTGPALFAGGVFSQAGGETTKNIAKWNGSSWAPLTGPSGTGTNGSVYALAVYDDGTGPALFAGGSFTEAGGVSAHNIARWDGVTWSAFGDTDGPVWALAACDDGTGPALYVGGDFDVAGGPYVRNIAKWDGASWSYLGSPYIGRGTDGPVYALASFDDGTGEALAVGGEFDVVMEFLPVSNIAKYRNGSWFPIDATNTGFDDTVRALAVCDDNDGPGLCVGGTFSLVGGLIANHIARFDGSSWSGLTGPSGTGTDREVWALATYDDGSGPALFVGGGFTLAGGIPSSRLGSWRRVEALFVDGFESGATTAWSATLP